jgi:hypothetical protein
MPLIARRTRGRNSEPLPLFVWAERNVPTFDMIRRLGREAS